MGDLIEWMIEGCNRQSQIDRFTSRKDLSDQSSLVPEDYKILNTSQRVVNLILGTAKLSNEWDGIRPQGAA